ncbi:class I SAM-dependent RNA methyltransferase [Ruficoccus amylovorans]|uniref:Class I SAM-dependent RNA methyltransferase n=1 Tax=Ruficoccus amylovorans TaxID=1804625 RepID=A0A842HHT9_9BACT|nr:class I SAM-dependent RNA methyltransferase [Ruficoccus amylovorans]MBC2596093.1 class I SAM-dependent RNA methyltransferase [Ruficoccus amylovorans]
MTSPQAPKNFKPEPFAYHEELELRVDTLTNLGSGLGRVNGWVVMVPFALPGERVRVRVYRNHKQHSDADLLEIIEPSPERVDPLCPLFGTCGGCQYQHMSYAAQREWKRQQVSELLVRLAGITHPVNPTHGSPREYHYRSKLTPHYPKPFKPKPGEAATPKREMPIGFLHQGQRNRIVDVPACPIATEAINEALPTERKRIRERSAKLKKGGTLLLRHTLDGVTTDNNASVTEKIGPVVFQFLAGDFFQNNPFILPELVDFVMERACIDGVRYLVDAYCGVGVFALCGARRFERVAGVEVNASAVKWANANAAINGIKNAEFYIGEAESIFSAINFPGDETAMIIDPPRAGCDEAFIRQLLALGPRRVVYVSCDPSTQARDLKMLLTGGYTLEEVQPFDLFPQTRHIENVAVLRLG